MSVSRPTAALRAASTVRKAALITGLMTALVTALVTALALVPALLLPGTAHAADDDASPLTVRLTRLTPATVPAKGRIHLVGTVRNDSDETWSAINVHPFLSHSPITSREELAAAAATDPETEVGDRIIQAGLFAAIGDLAPGQSAPFRITLPVSALRLSLPGVYWIGVHALGENDQGRGTLGRARTFIPLVPPGRPLSQVALVVPVREEVRRDSEGRLAHVADWSQTLSSAGRLRRVVDFLAQSGSQQVSALIDPAVLEAVGSIAAGNPPISFGEQATPTPTPSATQSSRSLDRLDAPDRADAAAWLEDVKALAGTRPVLGLAYNDPDTAGLARYRPTMLARAERLAAQTFERLQIDAVPTVAPPEGWLDDDALPAIGEGSLVLLSDHGAPRTRSQWRTSSGQDLVFSDAQASSGGPGPTPRLDALALRQRIIADAALRAGGPGDGPLVVQLPATWDPGPAWEGARFFETLDSLGWLSLTGVVHPDPSTPTFDAALGYPTAERRREIGPTNIGVAADLIRTGSVLGQLLKTQNDVDHALSGDALAAVSYHARSGRAEARTQVLSLDGRMQNRLGDVAVTGTDFVRLSGGTGTVAVTLVNRLEQPITVGISARTDSAGVRLDTPKPFAMAPGERRVLRLRTHASSIGVHEVTLSPVTAKGEALGTPLTFSLRTSEVGTLIWYVIGAAGLLLVVMIGRRIVRGLREHRWRGAE